MAALRIAVSAIIAAAASAGRIRPDPGVIDLPHVVLPDSVEDGAELSRWAEGSGTPFVDLPGEWSSLGTAWEVFVFNASAAPQLFLDRASPEGVPLQRWRLSEVRVVEDDAVGVGSEAREACFVVELVSNFEAHLPDFASSGNVWCRGRSAVLGLFPECMDFGPLRNLCKEDAFEDDDDYYESDDEVLQSGEDDLDGGDNADLEWIAGGAPARFVRG